MNMYLKFINNPKNKKLKSSPSILKYLLNYPKK